MSNIAKLWWSSISQQEQRHLFTEYYGLTNTEFVLDTSIQIMYEFEAIKRVMT